VRRRALAARDILLAAVEDGLAQRLATDILHLLEIPGGEIPRGQRPEGISHTSDGGSAVIFVDTRLRMLDHRFRVGLLGVFEPLRIYDMRLLPLGRIEYDRLEAFRSHYGSQATASGDARRTVILVQVLDACRAKLHLPALTDQREGDVRSVFFQQPVRGVMDAQAYHTMLTPAILGLIETRSMGAQVHHPPAGSGGHILDDKSFDAQIPHLQAGRTAGVGLFDPAGEGAFASDGEAVTGGKHVADQ